MFSSILESKEEETKEKPEETADGKEEEEVRKDNEIVDSSKCSGVIFRS